MGTSINANSKVFWSYVNGLKKSGELPSKIFFKERRDRNNLGIADLFSERFSEVFAAPAHNSNLIFNSIIAHDSFCDFKFTDAIPVVLVKQCTSVLLEFVRICNVDHMQIRTNSNRTAVYLTVLTRPLAMLFRRLDSGYFPSCWKLAYITPIYKDDDRHNVLNYRPVSLSSLLNVFAKVFE